MEVPKCPRHHISMVLRTAKKGKYKGKEFFGCPYWPDCSETISLAIWKKSVNVQAGNNESGLKGGIINTGSSVINPIVVASKRRTQESLKDRVRKPKRIFSQYSKKRK